MRTVKARQLMLLLGDVIVLYLSLAIALLIRYGMGEFADQYALHSGPMSLIFLLWIIILYVNGMYDLYVAKPSQAFMRRFVESWLISVGVAVTLFYLLPFFTITPKTNLFLLSALFGVLFVGWRLLGNRLTRADIRVLAIHPDADITSLLLTLQRNPQLGYRVIGVVNSQKNNGSSTDSPLQEFTDTTPIRAIVSEHQVTLILVPKNMRDTHTALYGELYELLFWNVYTMPSENFFESLTGRVPLSALRDSWFFENLRPNHLPLYDAVQRIMDCVLAVFGILGLTVLTPLVALFIKWRSPGPLFFLQERVGRNGKKFNVIKFRTMHALNKDGSAEIAGAQMTTRDDPRVTPFGAFIRTLRLDELPQVINVLKGDMSFIGPRPERPQFVAEFEKHMPYYTVRHLVKPGLSGWAQINYPYAETVEQQLTKFQYDLYYIKNRSFLLDITIVLKTLHVVLYGKGR
ncbi:MAG: hypothetical protein A2848_02320 [Candidatus Magasanikbacteria bacterium RIFCSPHIGHO2_01_FULL_50_8]|uniref:Bacterial sugar transferase domain-containing protein n=2 Tax=Candidatus Magasanikiibacteriota TaxID=1752731 RepID=A0A1F6LQQ1_9BACT|nr:MAG: hypothetical protein A2848_02320 [Candidatus Magasanikbacteria bacterium RIFCSPHIGHO2_01_FULL_50_8]OGH67727.1 MAG: hypothetical protein A3C15_04270 [Candidatus Magasanikbacteria bacterium RIFCSPHIGHO2_02_FULL_50_9b]